jgi:HD-GYP domain-containing protein (c-di-GMP phosphodiesterase class II)
MTDAQPVLAEALQRLLEADAIGADPLWAARIGALAQRVGALADRDADACLYALIASKAHGLDAYSSRHALASAGIAGLCAVAGGFGAAERLALGCAALTMNVAMTALQDELVHRERTPTLAQRRAIDAHPSQGAALLREAGVGDPLWLEIIERHHEPPPPAGEEELVEPGPARRLARLLQKVDVFLAKLSPRAARKGLPAPVALRESCLDAAGRSDPAGRALVQTLGLYPPASVVRLANGDTAVVTGRGAGLDRPRVASVTGPDRRALAAPLPRDPERPEFRAVAAVRSRELPGALDDRRLEPVLRAVQAACFAAP